MADFYSCDDSDEFLTEDRPEDAMHEFIRECYDFSNLEKVTKVLAWNRVELSPQRISWAADRAIDAIADSLHELYGDPEQESNWNWKQAKDAQDELAEFLHGFLERNWTVWHCERAPAEDIEFNTAEWIRENHQELLDDDEVKEALARLEAEDV